MKSIEDTQTAAKKQVRRLKVSASPLAKAIGSNFFDTLGIGHLQFSFFFKDLPVGIALNKVIYSETGIPIDFVTLDVNLQYEKMLGLKREQILNRQTAGFYLHIPNAPVDWVTIFGKVATTGHPERFEIQHPKSERFYFVTVHSPKKGYCIAAFMDVTEQKLKVTSKLSEKQRIEASLKENLEKYQGLIKNVPVAICEIDPDNLRFKSVNDTMTQVLGYSERELLKLSPFDLLYPESRQRFQEQIEKGLDVKLVAESMEYHCKTKDGRGIWCILKIKLNPIGDKPSEVLVVLHDITARKKAEQQLVFAEKKYRRLYETTQDGIMARDLKGKMIDCNQAYAKMLGYTKKELKKLTIKDLLPKKYHSQRERVVNKVLQTGRSIVFEREYRRKDGSIFPASVRTWRLTDGKGNVIGIWSIVRDITEQKQLQKSLEKYAGDLERIVEERTKQLKDSERLVAIGQTAAMVGHDLRNPLQTLLGELYLAKTEIEDISDPQASSNLIESIHVIEDQIAYMDKIVSDLQAFVQPVSLEKKPVELQALLNNVLANVVVPPNISVQINNHNIVPTINADPQLIKRVLINLVTNAVQAMPNGGNLTLAAKINSARHVSISVEDTGVGIGEKIKGQIFTPLFTTKPRGQGFGLAVCKRVIEAHGGTISFESQEGKGTTFTIKFPAN